MKEVVISFIVVFTLIGVCVGVSVLIYNNLISSVASASELGFDEGYARGYEDGFKEGSEAGYQEGSRVVYAKDKEIDGSSDNVAGLYFLYNPTYDEVREILVESDMDSAKEIHDYAEINGIRVGYVRCPIARRAPEGRVYLYQLVAFETVDRGLIIIEPWSHREVKVEVGKSYRDVNGFPVSPYDDTVTKMTIVW
jgi:hypothetical protein